MVAVAVLHQMPRKALHPSHNVAIFRHFSVRLLLMLLHEANDCSMHGVHELLAVFDTPPYVSPANDSELFRFSEYVADIQHSHTYIHDKHFTHTHTHTHERTHTHTHLPSGSSFCQKNSTTLHIAYSISFASNVSPDPAPVLTSSSDPATPPTEHPDFNGSAPLPQNLILESCAPVERFR
jgi:hypothetical protein